MKTVDIELSKIKTGKYSLRDDTQKAASRIASSVEKVGLLHPLVVVKQRGGNFQLVSGHVRLETLKQAGAESAPCVALDADNPKAVQAALSENFARVDLNPLEKAKALHRLEEQGMKRSEIAELIGVSPAQVSNLLALFSLEPEVQEAINKGKIQFGHAKALLALKGDKALQLKALKEIQRIVEKGEKASARTVEELVRKLKPQEEGATPKFDLKLPKKVKLQETARTKRVVIDFKNLEELKSRIDEILSMNFS